MKIIPIKRALISVSNKTGIVDFARNLNEMGIEIISTGGTSQLLTEAGLVHRKVEEITGFPEMLGGRVKTLHPKIHGGILGRRDKHAAEAAKHAIDWIDLVVVNFYPFSESQGTWDEVIEYIDIGGPAMARAAAKNFAWVGVVLDPNDYPKITAELRETKSLSFETREKLAAKTYALTSAYDAMVANYFLEISQEKHAEPKELTLQLQKQAELRYGENPHQKAFAYQFKDANYGVLTAKKLQGKTLSYNNILDSEAAINILSEFESPSCVIVKHANPCGVAVADGPLAAYLKAYEADPVSAFGGIVALNRPCDALCAKAIVERFTEVLLAPAFSEEALSILAAKPNLRIILLPPIETNEYEMRFISGGMLLQERDMHGISRDKLKLMTKETLQDKEISELLFAWRVVKHIKSNAILIAKDNRTLGIGAGQVSRIDAVEIALQKAGEGRLNAVLASDAFFPFRDSIDRIAKAGVRAIIQPGGSVRDEEVIAACNEHGIAMVFTGVRCFKH